MTRPPLAPLVQALYCDKYPPLDWVIEWSKDGRDPVTCAWEASAYGDDMAQLLWLYLRRRRADVLIDAAKRVPEPPAELVNVYDETVGSGGRSVRAELVWQRRKYFSIHHIPSWEFLRPEIRETVLRDEREHAIKRVRMAAIESEMAVEIRRLVPPPTMAWVEEYLQQRKEKTA